MRIEIRKKLLGDGDPCFIIAEAGVNHNGDFEVAKKLVDAAFEAGANAVKFQTFSTEKLVTQTAPKPEYQKRGTPARESQFSMLKSLELPLKQQRELKLYADRTGIIFLSTPYDEESVDFLVEIGAPALKISSADITNLPLLAYAASKGIPIILSTGMSTLGEVEEAVGAIRDAGSPPLALLHCNFNYPAAYEDVNLRAMGTLRQAFQVPVGYSDHTPGYEVCLAAVALGAVIIEKHFTLDRGLPGPDHKASIEPGEMRELVAGIRKVEKALGSPVKRPSGGEIPNRAISRRSIVAAVDIAAGATISREMLTAKRPGSGLQPAHIADLVGRKARYSMSKDELIDWEKVE
ncbi:MAG: N-acetylneuraminate synthase [Chloroflexi bacterium]|nr:N-acetylneuraminate synthase [Chloroflexota bacterium]